jgi:hypothetical protein
VEAVEGVDGGLGFGGHEVVADPLMRQVLRMNGAPMLLQGWAPILLQVAG